MTVDLICNGKVVYDMAEDFKAVYTFMNTDLNIMFSTKAKDSTEFDLGDKVTMTLIKK